MVEPVLRPNWCARHRFPKPLENKNARRMPAVLPLCKDQAGPLTEGRNTTAKSHAGAALHSCIVPRQCIQPFTQTTSWQNHRSADAPRGTAVESSPQKTSAPAQVLCDRLRLSRNCRLKSFHSTAQIIDRKTARQPFRRGKVVGTTRQHQRDSTALQNHRSSCAEGSRLKATRLLIRPHSHSTAFESLE